MAKKEPPKTIEEMIDLLLKEITPPQREALLRRQLGLFDHGNVLAKGPTASALRRRHLIGPNKAVTDLGAKICERLSAA